jgi:hypothetical protein
MAIRTVVTRGFGNGTFNGTIALVVLRGYIAGVGVAIPIKSFISTEADMTRTSKEADQTHVSLEADQTKDNPRC